MNAFRFASVVDFVGKCCDLENPLAGIDGENFAGKCAIRIVINSVERAEHGCGAVQLVHRDLLAVATVEIVIATNTESRDFHALILLIQLQARKERATTT